MQVATDTERSLVELNDQYEQAASCVAEGNDYRQRCRAVGEYMAAYAHLLIAVWDHHHITTREGAAASIVAARRAGLTPALLPTAGHLIVPHGGPVLQIYTHRLRNPRDRSKDAPLRFLQAYGVEGEVSTPDNAASWQEEGLTLMTRIAANLDWFNESKHVWPERAKQELCSRLTYRSADRSLRCLVAELETHCEPLMVPLRRLTALRRRASDQSQINNQATKRTHTWLFLLTGLAACALDLFAHWNPQNEHRGDPGSEQQAQFSTTPLTDQPESVEQRAGARRREWWLLNWAASSLTQVRIGLVSIGAFILALVWYWHRRAQNYDERDHDYRAIAEGARVQFYWRLAGLVHSVSANYMHRQRSELDWIRGAIRATAFPYEDARLCYASLPAEQQIKALRCVLCSWIEDQRKYFRKNSKDYRTRLHFWHTLGNTLALTGAWLAMILVIDACIGTHLEWLSEFGGYLLFAVVLVIVLTFRKEWRKVLTLRLHELVDLCVPEVEERGAVHRLRQAEGELLRKFCVHAPASLTLAAAALGLAAVFADHAQAASRVSRLDLDGGELPAHLRRNVGGMG